MVLMTARLPAHLRSSRSFRPFLIWAAVVLVAFVAQYIAGAACRAGPPALPCIRDESYFSWLLPVALWIWLLIAIYCAWWTYKDYYLGELEEDRIRAGFDPDG
jgi:hypothetical protein